MTIERHTSYFGIIKKEPVVLYPGTSEVVEFSKGRFASIGRAIHVIDHDTIEIEHLASVLPNDTYSKDAINRVGITSYPLGLDFFMGKIKRYEWKPGVPVKEKVKEKAPRKTTRLSPRRA